MSQAATTQVNEAGIIGQIRRRFSCTNNRLLVGLGDDAAVIGPEEGQTAGRRLNVCSQVLATDILVEGVHFSRRYMNLREIGYKAVSVNVSDMAAMGAECVYALGNLGVPRDASNEEVGELLDGVSDALEEFGASLIGGDTVRAPQWLLSFSMIGSISSEPLTRSAAAPGDVVWHSGELGLSQVGFHRLQGGEREGHADVCQAHLHPLPQLALGQWLSREGLASACIDLSDSLSQCLLQIAEASNVGLQLDLQQYEYAPLFRQFCEERQGKARTAGSGFSVPGKMQADRQTREYGSPSEFLLESSEDYQLLFTAPAASTARLLRDAPVPLRRIGTVLPADEGLMYVDEQGRNRVLEARGYQH
ncbi:thiamine-phosphate kinase [bacterium]|nr:thiamine-phosphate kinase [bacterium]